MKFFKYILTLFAALYFCGSLSAQYYSWGADAENLSWRKIKGNKVSVIFPDTATMLGYRMMHYVKAVQPTIDFGFRFGAIDIPFVIHPENSVSNGLVMWLPKRVEILSSPSIESYSMPWLKQLAAHEYRHAVQYNNLNHGWVKVFSYILGQQSSTIGLLFMPLWALEGDAVISETSYSSFGRALQPSFTIDFRARGLDVLARKNLDKWFCGSYKEHIPDHYLFGYQLTAFANTKYNENVWDKVVNYSVRNPYVILANYVALRKFYKTDATQLTKEAFTDLNNFWATLPEVSDSATPIPTPKQRSFTSYRYPMHFGQRSIISVKKDLDTPTTLVRTNMETGEEEKLCRIGRLSTRPIMQENRIWWTEYRRSLLFQQRVGSRLCYMDLGTNSPKTVHKHRSALYPTAIDDKKDIAWVEYRPEGIYSVVVGGTKSKREIVRFPIGTEIHSLAYDNLTDKFYFIATADDGMWIGSVDMTGKTESVTEPAFITISDLRARDGILYFGSIESGKDEAHAIDIATKKEYRISTSKYGSFSPSPTFDNRVVMTTYNKNGYQLSIQNFDKEKLHSVTRSKLPQNIVNPPRKEWKTINLDTVRFTAADSAQMFAKNRARRYSKISHMFNVHSWAPASYDPFSLVEEGQMNFNLGATVMSQSLLSNTEGFATWGWNQSDGHFFKGTLRYYGLGVNISVSGSYGGKQQMYTAYTYQKNEESGQYEIVFPDAPVEKRYYSIGAKLSLPLYFERGYHSRILLISGSWNYSNGLVAKLDKLTIEGGKISNLATIGYSEGLHLLQAGVTFQDQVSLAHKDFLPRFGYTIAANYAFNPANSDFGRLISLYGKLYLPGFARHNSFNVAALYQNSIGGFESKLLASNFSFHSAGLIPHGFHLAEIGNRNYLALATAYQLPVWYPDGGISSLIYFKRVRLNLGFDYASFDKQQFIAYPNLDKVNLIDRREHLFSYGGDITLDINLLRMPASATTSVTLSLYKPHGKKGVWVSAGIGLPF